MSTWPNRGASGGPCGGLEEEKTEQPKQSDHASLTQANKPPRNPVRFNTEETHGHGHERGPSERACGRCGGQLRLGQGATADTGPPGRLGCARCRHPGPDLDPRKSIAATMLNRA